MFRRITAAASRLFAADHADGTFYGLERLNARVRSMLPTHPALALLWCQLLLLVGHTDYRWWAEVQQTPRYVRPRPGGLLACLVWIVLPAGLPLVDAVLQGKCAQTEGAQSSHCFPSAVSLTRFLLRVILVTLCPSC